MHRFTRRVNVPMGFTLSTILLLAACGVANAGETHQARAGANAAWHRSIDLAQHGEFSAASDTLKQVDNASPLAEQVRGWLETYEAGEEARRELNRAEFAKYVEYAQVRIQRKEYILALEKTLHAHDVAEDRDAFLRTDWVLQLVKDSLDEAAEMRAEHEWRGAWDIYGFLGALYEHDPRYKQLEREVVTQLRLESMFKADKVKIEVAGIKAIKEEWKDLWMERIEKVRWKDAETALQYMDHYYVTPIDFRKVGESGLEQLLMLADSVSAQKRFKKLGNELDRHDFKARITLHLERMRDANEVDRSDVAGHFRRVVKRINKETVNLPEELVVSELMRGALEPLDDFTAIIWPQAAPNFDKHTRGDFIGVGISIVKNRMTDEVEVVSPMPGSPAYRGGIQSGDIITGVNGMDLAGYTLNKVVETITGPKGTDVLLTIRRKGKSMDFPLTRERVNIESVKGVARDTEDEENWDYWLDEAHGIATVRVEGFQGNTVHDLEQTLAELSEQGMRGLVLDLRGNPGGLLDSAWAMARLFLRSGDEVVSTKGRTADENRTFRVPKDGPFVGLPLVVLVDESSASASEIVAGALRDHNRGAVIGWRTFGKFSVQNLMRLSRSSGAKLKLTTAKYYLPNGDSLHREPDSTTWGVEPTIPVRLTRTERRSLYSQRRVADRLGPQSAQLEADKNEKGEKDEATDDGNDSEATPSDDAKIVVGAVYAWKGDHWVKTDEDGVWVGFGGDVKWSGTDVESQWFQIDRDEEWVRLDEDGAWAKIDEDDKWLTFDDDGQWVKIGADGKLTLLSQDRLTAAAVKMSRFKPPSSIDIDKLSVRPASPDKPNTRETVLLDGKPVTLVCRGIDGKIVEPIDVRVEEEVLWFKGPMIEDAQTMIASITVNGLKARRIALPLLKQPDDIKRPEGDAQLDAALLLLRVSLAGETHPTLVTADADAGSETQAQP